MSSVPREVLRDVLHPLDRWTLDAVQFTNRRFLRLILERMSDVCLRQVEKATFRGPEDYTTRVDDGSWRIRIHGRPEREISSTHKDVAHLFSGFVQALRNTRVASLTFGLVFTPAIAELALETPIVARELHFDGGSCAELTPAHLHKLLLHFSPIELKMSKCQLRACQVSDEFVRALIKNRVRRTSFPWVAPVDGDRFHVTDDAVVEFCMQPDVQASEEEGESYWDLVVYKGNFSKNLFKRLVEASAVSTRTQPVHISVYPPPVVEEDLRDFSQYLSHRPWPELPYELPIYNFPDEQHGAGPTMHLQISLHPHLIPPHCGSFPPSSRLSMVRAQRPNRFFMEPNE